jgi:hypothetical protein
MVEVADLLQPQQVLQVHLEALLLEEILIIVAATQEPVNQPVPPAAQLQAAAVPLIILAQLIVLVQ